MRIFFTWLKSLFLFLMVVAAAGYFIYTSEWFQKNCLYPFPYQEIVYRHALKNEVDPFLAVAVIRTESKFLPEARSDKGAVGLMQMMPETARWVAGQIKYNGFYDNLLNDPEVNICFGTWYLASLNGEFNNNEVLVLAAYNGGRGNVKEWMRKYGWTDEFHEIEAIPFKETRDYVRKVLEAKKRYQSLYGR
ncbi:MAG: slt 2 [Firmicutes bacterium]|nr:slt 2 [Bacillota bacterium]